MVDGWFCSRGVRSKRWYEFTFRFQGWEIVSFDYITFINLKIQHCYVSKLRMPVMTRKLMNLKYGIVAEINEKFNKLKFNKV